jgi:uncharacterized metal-binding protein YceD (DUF177 family)
MTRTTPDAVAPLPFDHDLPVAHLVRNENPVVKRALTPAEGAALADFLGIEAVEALALDARIAQWGEDGWEITGRLTGRVVQACVVSLEAVAQDIDQPVTRRYLPAHRIEPLPEVELSADAPDEPEPLGSAIDVAGLMTEVLVLALDPYPRAPDATPAVKVHAGPGVTPLTDEAMRPFAGLAALKDRLEPGNR